MNPAALLARLDEIGRSLIQSGHAIALIGLGSVGEELHRLDEYSDLDSSPSWKPVINAATSKTSIG